MELNEKLRNEYQQLFDTCAIREERRAGIDRLVDRILDNRPRYEVVEAFTSVPWQVIAAIHSLECSLRFDRHLHNGDPLSSKTKREPKGRPPGSPPFTWEKSAQDALAYDRLTHWAD